MNSNKKQKEQNVKKLSIHIQDNIKEFENRFLDCNDIIRREMKIGDEGQISCFIAYVEGTVSNTILQESVIGTVLNHLWNIKKEQITAYLEDNRLGIADLKQLATMDEVVQGMLSGDAVFFIDGYDKALKIPDKGYSSMGVQKAEAEKVIRGSKEAFGESVKLNTSLIRKRLRDSRIKVKEVQIGLRSHTTVSIVYMSDLVMPDLFTRLEEHLKTFEIDGVLDSGIIEQILEKKWYSPFPQFQTTERPDRAAMAILEGRIVLLSDNSPMGLILPTNYNNFFQTADDYFMRWEIASFLRLLRYITAILSMALPGFYLAITNFHTQLLPTDMILSFAAAREGVPFPALIEVILMELSFELIREAGVRLPGVIGNTIGIVGGLIIGQAAVSANLVSPIIVVLIALTALSSFAVPNEELATAFRLIKFVIIFLSAWLGFYGFILGLLVVLIHLAHLKSFGIPYLMPFTGNEINEKEDGKDSIIRLPLFLLKKRSIYARKEERIKFKRK